MKILKTAGLLVMAGVIGTMALNAKEIKSNYDMFENSKGMVHIFKAQKSKIRGILKQLNLTKTQKAQIRENRNVMIASIKSKRAENLKHRDITKFITVDGVNRDVMTKEATKKVTQMVNIGADMIDSSLKVLSMEQRKKFISLLKAK